MGEDSETPAAGATTTLALRPSTPAEEENGPKADSTFENALVVVPADKYSSTTTSENSTSPVEDHNKDEIKKPVDDKTEKPAVDDKEEQKPAPAAVSPAADEIEKKQSADDKEEQKPAAAVSPAADKIEKKPSADDKEEQQPAAAVSPAVDKIEKKPPADSSPPVDDKIKEKKPLADEKDEKNPPNAIDRDVALAKVELNKKMALIKAWEENEKTKADNKAYKKLSAIESWENSKRASVEAELKLLEEKIERKKAEYAEKMKNKMAEFHRQAEEKRAIVEAHRGEDVLKAEETAAKFRATGRIPKRLLGCFNF